MMAGFWHGCMPRLLELTCADGHMATMQENEPGLPSLPHALSSGLDLPAHELLPSSTGMLCCRNPDSARNLNASVGL